MKKLIKIEIICDTNKDDEYIKKSMTHGIYRALDTEPNYISAPKDVESIGITVTKVAEIIEIGDNVVTTDYDLSIGIKKGDEGIVISTINGFPKVLFKDNTEESNKSRIFVVDPTILKKK